MHALLSLESVPSKVSAKVRLNCKELCEFSVSPDRQWLASADPKRGAVSVWSVPPPNAVPAAFKLQNMARLPRASRAWWLNTRFTAAAAQGDTKVYVIPNNRGGGGGVVVLQGHTAPVLCVCGPAHFPAARAGALEGGESGSGGSGVEQHTTRVAAGAQNGCVRVWEVVVGNGGSAAPTATLVLNVECPAVAVSAGGRVGPGRTSEPSPCSAVALSADGHTLAIGYRNSAVVVWDCRSDTLILGTRGLHEDVITSLDFAPPLRIAVGRDGGGDGGGGGGGVIGGGGDDDDDDANENDFGRAPPLRLLSVGRDSCLRIVNLALVNVDGGGGGGGGSGVGAERAVAAALTLTCPGFRIRASNARACFSPGGRFVAAGSDTGGDVVLWDTMGGAQGQGPAKVVKKFRTHDHGGGSHSPVTGVAWAWATNTKAAAGSNPSSSDNSSSSNNDNNNRPTVLFSADQRGNIAIVE